MNRTGSVSIVIVLLVVAGVAAAGWFLLSGEEVKQDPPAVVDNDPPVPDKGGENEINKPGRARTDPPKSSGTGTSVVPEGRPAPVPTELRGVVKDEQGNAIKGASVQIIHYDFDQDPSKRIHDRFIRRIVHQTATDDEGNWVFEKLTPSNKHYISASSPGYLEQIKDNVQVGLLVNFTLRKGARVEGKVLDLDTGKPVANAKVRGWYKTGNGIRDVNRIYRWQETQITKADGSFSFEGCPVAVVKFMLYHPEFEDYAEDLPVNAGQVNRLEFKMKRGVVIEGIVKNKLHDTPIKGVQVQVTEVLVPKFATETDENGRFRVTGLKPGTQIFTFMADGYTHMRSPTEISESDNFDSKQNNLLEFYMDPAGRAAGVVYDPDGNPIDNARVFVGRRNPLMTQIRDKAEFHTKADGQFLVNDIGTDADHVIVAYRDGHGIGVSESFRIGPEELRDDLVVRLTRGGSISGIIRDENDVPIAGARVQVDVPPYANAWFPPGMDIGQQSQKIVVTAEDGRYEITGLWTGQFKFNITHDRHVALVDQRVMLKETDEHIQNDFRMKIGRFLAGTCMDASGSPAEGTVVSVTRPFNRKVEANATVDQNGNWRIDGLVKGTYNVQAKKEGYSSELLKEIPADTDNLHFRLRENGSLIGSVMTPDGNPVTRFMVGLRPQDDGTPKSFQWSMQHARPSRSFADQGGNFHYPALEPGDYVVTVRTSDYPDLIIENVNVPSGSAGSISARLKGGGSLAGTVRDQSGQPVVDAVIVLVRDYAKNPDARMRDKGRGTMENAKHRETGEDKGNGRPAPDGTYRMKGLEAGDYFVRITSNRYVGPPQQPVLIAEGQETRMDFTLSLAGDMTVTVTDDFGDPVLGAAVIIVDESTGRRPMSMRGGPRTDARGSVTLTGIPSGTFKMTINRSGYIVKQVNFTMTPGGSMRESAQLEKIR